MASEAHRFLTSIATELRRENAAISRMDSALVERDIAVRRREAALGRRWAGLPVENSERNSKALGSVKPAGREELGCDIRTMRRRVQLAKGWVQYERVCWYARNNGQFGLVIPVSCLSPSRSVPQRMVIACPFVPQKEQNLIGPITLPNSSPGTR